MGEVVNAQSDSPHYVVFNKHAKVAASNSIRQKQSVAELFAAIASNQFADIDVNFGRYVRAGTRHIYVWLV